MRNANFVSYAAKKGLGSSAQSCPLHVRPVLKSHIEEEEIHFNAIESLF